MSGVALDFGSLSERLERVCAAENIERSADAEFRSYLKAEPEGGNPLVFAAAAGRARNLMRSAGPISDAYILAANPADLVTGPGGSGKTTASVKKALVEAQRIWPGADGVRRYVLGNWRQKYVNLWKAAIPSWWSILPKDLPGSSWTGAPPRDATHVVRFRDRYGHIELITHFRAFGEQMDPEDLLGNQYTDCYFGEWSTMPEALSAALVDRVGRDPPASVIRRTGRFYGDSNAPDVLNYIYRDFYELAKPGHVLHRQPGGLDPGAENLEAVTRAYYENSVMMNAHRPWWVKRMVHARPGFTRDNNPVYAKWDDDRNMSRLPLGANKQLPVIVGVDGGNTPAAVWMQERSDGQLRILAEVGLRRGGMRELATEMLALEAALFADCEFHTVCDPAMTAGEEKTDMGDVVPMEDSRVSEGSDRQRLSKYLARKVQPARTQEVGARIDALNAKFDLTLEDGQPGLIVDARCKGIRRGMNQTYHYRQLLGSDDTGSVAKTFDGHRIEAGQYGALECGTAQARRLVSERRRQLERQREEARKAPPYRPLGRWKGRQAGNR